MYYIILFAKRAGVRVYEPGKFLNNKYPIWWILIIGVRDGARGHVPPPPKKKKIGKIFVGQLSCKIQEFC